MRKRGARVRPAMKSYLLLPEQVARYVLPLHMALELLPLGLFSKDNGNHLAMVINLIAVDAADTGNGMWKVADEAGHILLRMHERVKAGGNWGATTDERRTLTEAITKFDRYMRTWTSARLIANSATVDAINEQSKANGGQFLDRMAVEEVA